MLCAGGGESTDAITWNVIREESWVDDVRAMRTVFGVSQRRHVVNRELACDGTSPPLFFAAANLMECLSLAFQRALCSQGAAPSTPASESGLEVATRRARMYKRARSSHSSARPRGTPPSPILHPILRHPSTLPTPTPTASSRSRHNHAPAVAKME